MGDETPSTMNLDLNLGPIDQPNDDTGPGTGLFQEETMNLEDWLNISPMTRIRDVVRQRRQRWRPVWRHAPLPPETRNIALEVNGGSGLQPGEGSVAAEERLDVAAKMCENNNGILEGEALGKKDDDEKGIGGEGSFFDCNICLDLAKDPVVTCCGHLFCWPCLYRWLHIHSDAKECPICKGEVTIKDVTPIYGRGSSTRELEEDSGLKIPQRPQARRVESWRQAIQRAAFAIPMEEMIRRLGRRFDLTRDLVQVQPQNAEDPRGSPERSNSLLNRILTSRGMRREQNTVIPSDVVIDLTESSPSNSELGESRLLSPLLRPSNSELGESRLLSPLLRPNSERGESRLLSPLLRPSNSERGESRLLSPLLRRRSSSHRAASISNLTSALSSERLVESYFQNRLIERYQEPQLVDDRDSVSSIAAIIHSESQTVDTAVEIDSNVSLSTSSSRRRNDTSRVSDVDSGDSRPPRRRRLN